MRVGVSLTVLLIRLIEAVNNDGIHVFDSLFEFTRHTNVFLYNIDEDCNLFLSNALKKNTDLMHFKKLTHRTGKRPCRFSQVTVSVDTTDENGKVWLDVFVFGKSYKLYRVDVRVQLKISQRAHLARSQAIKTYQVQFNHKFTTCATLGEVYECHYTTRNKSRFEVRLKAECHRPGNCKLVPMGIKAVGGASSHLVAAFQLKSERGNVLLFTYNPGLPGWVQQVHTHLDKSVRLVMHSVHNPANGSRLRRFVPAGRKRVLTVECGAAGCVYFLNTFNVETKSEAEALFAAPRPALLGLVLPHAQFGRKARKRVTYRTDPISTIRPLVVEYVYPLVLYTFLVVLGLAAADAMLRWRPDQVQKWVEFLESVSPDLSRHTVERTVVDRLDDMSFICDLKQEQQELRERLGESVTEFTAE